MDLKELRKEIDEVDSQLLKLLTKRMGISKQVAEYKIQNNIPVLNQQRENEILDSIAERSGELADSMKIIYATIMDVSRAEQHRIMNAGSALRETIKNARQFNEQTNSTTVVACPGVIGSYSSEATKKMFTDAKVEYCETFSQVFEQIKNGNVDFGVIPVENSTAGSVHETYDLLMKNRFYIVKAFDMPIHHCLCAKKRTELKDIKNVISHTQAISQCRDFIIENGYKAIECSNTAIAAKQVSEGEATDTAAICSAHAAKEYSLETLLSNIQTSTTNTTRFIAVSKELLTSDNADKISLVFSAPHVTGSLYRILGRFSMAGLNLTKIESRPKSDSNFSYNFYLDLTGSVKDKRTLDLLCALSDELPYFNFIGNYNEENQN